MLITDPKKIAAYYEALLEMNPGYVGVFYVGVKTTSVFCIATCRARKPKLKNVEFYTTFKEALHNGYRPCKICQPTQNAHKPPHQVQKAIRLVKDKPKEKVSDVCLREMEISPTLVRRWFKKNYGMTFHAYQRMYRINYAFQELKGGQRTTKAAFDSGYESLSGFGYTFKKLIGRSPQNSLDQPLILINRLTTPIGPMVVCSTDRGICLLEFVDRKMLETEFRDLQRLLNARIILGENEHISQLKIELTQYFDGDRVAFDVALDTPGSDFQNLVWNTLRKVPFGKTTTYQQLAMKINKPTGIRAVGAANGQNRIAIVLPCHRIIGKDGQLRGYGGGLERKRWLLDHERQHDPQRISGDNPDTLES